MGRLIAGVVAGYVAMAAFIMVTFTVTAPMLGMDWMFAPGTYEASVGWLTLSLTLSVIGAIVGGATAAWVGRGVKAARVLAVVVLVLGLALAAVGLSDTRRGGPRAADATMTDAAANAKQPTWLTFVNPLIGAAGVLIGARRRTTSIE